MKACFLRCVSLLLLMLLFTGCGEVMLSTPEKAAWKQCSRLLAKISGELSACGYDSPAEKWQRSTLIPEDRARVEAVAAGAGFCILRSGRDIPEYLAEPEGLLQFLDQVQAGKDCAFSLFQITETGMLSCRYFWQENRQFYLTTLTCDPAVKGKNSILVRETYSVRNWTVSEAGNFFYQVFWEDDQHFANYSRIRLREPDPVLWQMTRECILSIGYSGTNMFLVDWAAPDYGNLSLNDLWDLFYYRKAGNMPNPEEFSYDRESRCYRIPAADFEELILPRFPMSREELQSVADYDPKTDTYSWLPLESELIIRFGHPLVEPEITACRKNEDGSLNVMVETVCTDLKLDSLYSHEVTIKERPDGTWQYLGNRKLTQPEDFIPLSRREVMESIV